MTEEHPDAELAAEVLTDAQAVRWALRHVHGLSVRKIAEVQGVSRASVRDSLEAAARAITKAKEGAG